MVFSLWVDFVNFYQLTEQVGGLLDTDFLATLWNFIIIIWPLTKMKKYYTVSFFVYQ